jgi:histidine triad (HIT) family protein
MMTVLSPEFVCMYARGRRIPHTHIFLTPTVKDDVLDRFFNALERFQESPPNLMRLRDKDQLKEAMEILRETRQDSTCGEG